jgi:hypothetical protein
MNYYGNEVPLETLVGRTIKSITGLEKGSDDVRVYTECGNEYMFYHYQDCCENVQIEDYDGYPEDLIGALIVSAEEVISTGDDGSETKGSEKPNEYSESWTWTFYKIETNKGGIWMRWLGESNGYYSESVDFVWVNKPYKE